MLGGSRTRRCGVFVGPLAAAPFRAGRHLLGVSLVLVISVTACASGSHKPPDFSNNYRVTVAQYRTQFGTLQTQAQGVLGKDLNSQLALFRHMDDVTGATLKQLRGLTPPPAIKPNYDRLVTAMTKQEISLAEIVTSAHKGDQVALNNALRGYASALQDGIALQQAVEQAVGSAAPNPSRS